MKKYWTVFTMSLGNQFAYRLNFLFGQLRQIVVLLLLYYVWIALTQTSGRFAGYTSQEFMTYVFGMALLRPIIFGSQSRDVAADINSGMFSQHLIKPINSFFYFYVREMAERLILFLVASVEIVFLTWFLDTSFAFPTSLSTLAVFGISIFLAHILYYFLSYFISLLAFWSREAMGPRFFFEWVLEFASGAYFPLTIISGAVFTLLGALPFFYLLFAPMSIFLGKMSGGFAIGMQLFWIMVVGFLTWFTWRRGIKRYTGEGV